MNNLASSSSGDVAGLRASTIKRWLLKATELEAEDNKLKSELQPEIRHITKTKRIALMRWIIEEYGYGDKELANDILKGFSLVGGVPRSNCLPKKFVPAHMTVQDLREQSDRSNVAIRYTTQSSGDLLTDAQLWEKTLSEVDQGWLLGPLSWKSLPAGSSISRRFPLQQSDKLRPIDDYSQSQVNDTVTVHEKPRVNNPDTVCAIFVYLMRSLQKRGRGAQLCARSLDLTSAYRQLCVAADSSSYAYLSVYDPTQGGAALFRQVALPFGSRTAVNAFIRCARFLQWVAAKCLKIPMSCYFDDFIISSTPGLSDNSQSAVALMFDILGWAFDKTGDKADSFSHSVAALGVVFNLASTGVGRVLVQNTEKRTAEVCALIESVLCDAVLSHKAALVLRGRLAFCDAFIFGRAGRLALQMKMESHLEGITTR